MICHSSRARYVLGFNAQQLNRNHNYGNVVDDQVRTLTHIQLFSSPVDTSVQPLLSAYDNNVPLPQRARTYLDINCAHCHGHGGAGTARFRLQVELELENTGLLNSGLTQGDFGLRHSRLIAPGDPYRSVLYYRMAKLGRGRMPHIGSHVVDDLGLRLIHDWIEQLAEQQSQVPDLDEIRSVQIADLQDLIAGRGDLPAVISRILETHSGALMLVSSLLENRFPAGVRDRIIELGGGSSNPLVSGVFEQFVPEAKRKRRVELNPSQILAVEGDPSRGERLFFHDVRLQCQNCHKIGEQGKEFGPDLTRIGLRRNATDLLASLLTPSLKMEPEYVSYVAITTEGKLHTGLLMERSADLVVLRESQTKQARLSTKDVVELIPQKVSLMPEGQLREMAAGEVADLLAFLRSRR